MPDFAVEVVGGHALTVFDEVSDVPEGGVLLPPDVSAELLQWFKVNEQNAQAPVTRVESPPEHIPAGKGGEAADGAFTAAERGPLDMSGEAMMPISRAEEN